MEWTVRGATIKKIRAGHRPFLCTVDLVRKREGVSQPVSASKLNFGPSRAQEVGVEIRFQ